VAFRLRVGLGVGNTNRPQTRMDAGPAMEGLGRVATGYASLVMASAPICFARAVNLDISAPAG